MAAGVDVRAVAVLLLALGIAAAAAVVAARQAPPAVPNAADRREDAQLAATMAGRSPAAARPTSESSGERSCDAAPVPQLTVEVVDAASGRPLPGADVWLLGQQADVGAPVSARWLPSIAVGPPEPWPGAPCVRAGADGTATMPRLESAAWVVARWGRLDGACCVAGDAQLPDAVRVVLAPGRRLTVVALDARGNAASGVPIALRPVAHAAADAAHVATVPLGVTSAPFGRLCVDLAPWAGSSDAVEVGVDVPGGSWRGVTVTPNAPPLDVVYLEAGATASLEVQVLCADGTPAPAGVAVQLGARDPAEGVMAFLRACFVSATDAQGRAVFPVVGCESPTWMRVVAPGQVVVRAIDPAPAGGPERRVTVALPEPRFVVRGRALDERGAPLRGAALQLGWQVGDARRPRSTMATTDEHGGFACALAGCDGGALRSARIARVAGGVLSDMGAVLGDVSLPDRGDVQLGDLRLAAAAVLAAGRIVGAGDAADVVLWVDDGDDGGAQCAGAWVERTAADAFVVRGEARAPGLRLCAARDGAPSAPPVPFAAGDRGLVVRVPAVVAPPSAPAMVSGDGVRVSSRTARVQQAAFAR